MFNRSSKVKKQDSSPVLSNSINTMVGYGSTVRGDFQIKGFLRIDGDLIGSLKSTERVVLGADARMKGNITAEEVVIAGVIVGDVVAHSKVKILSSAVVIGNISARRLIVEREALLDGVCSIQETRDNELISPVLARSLGEYFSPWKKDRTDVEIPVNSFVSE